MDEFGTSALNKFDQSGLAPLHLAARGDHAAVVEALAAAGADLSLADYRQGWSPAHWAAAKGNAAALRALGKAGAPLALADGTGNSPAFLLWLRMSPQLSTLLLD